MGLPEEMPFSDIQPADLSFHIHHRLQQPTFYGQPMYTSTCVNVDLHFLVCVMQGLLTPRVMISLSFY